MSYFARAESLSSLGEMPALRPQPASVGELCPRSLLLPSPTPEPPFRLHCSQPISQQGILPSKARRGNSKGREAVGQEVRAAFIQSDAFVHVRKAPPRFAGTCGKPPNPDGISRHCDPNGAPVTRTCGLGWAVVSSEVVRSSDNSKLSSIPCLHISHLTAAVQQPGGEACPTRP